VIVRRQSSIYFWIYHVPYIAILTMVNMAFAVRLHTAKVEKCTAKKTRGKDRTADYCMVKGICRAPFPVTHGEPLVIRKT
jgi:hypothetical protein